MIKHRLHRFGAPITQIIMLSALYSLLSTLTYAQTISSTELINNAKQYDGKQITYEGEVIGEIMARGDFAWINVNDGNNAIGVWLQKNLTGSINYTGSYNVKGDWIRVIGSFSRACQQHGGDLDIHAESLIVTSKGKPIKEKIVAEKRQFAFNLAGILCIVIILQIYTLVRRKMLAKPTP